MVCISFVEVQTIIQCIAHTAKIHKGKGMIAMIYRSNPPPVHSPPQCELYRVHEVQKKSAWDMGEVFGYLKKQSGIQFDADVVSALLAHENEVMAIYR